VNGVLLDTHAWAWGLIDFDRIPERVVQNVQMAEQVCIASVSVYEITQKVRLGKWPEMSGSSARLEFLAAERGLKIINLEARFASVAGLLD
jgi:PIN domain nuclease of toxin-antitoxin system